MLWNPACRLVHGRNDNGAYISKSRPKRRVLNTHHWVVGLLDVLQKDVAVICRQCTRVTGYLTASMHWQGYSTANSQAPGVQKCNLTVLLDDSNLRCMLDLQRLAHQCTRPRSRSRWESCT